VPASERGGLRNTVRLLLGAPFEKQAEERGPRIAGACAGLRRWTDAPVVVVIVVTARVVTAIMVIVTIVIAMIIVMIAVVMVPVIGIVILVPAARPCRPRQPPRSRTTISRKAEGHRERRKGETAQQIATVLHHRGSSLAGHSSLPRGKPGRGVFHPLRMNSTRRAFS